MPQTLRKTFSFKTHSALTPALRRGLQMPLSLEGLLNELHQYLKAAKSDLLQPRQAVIDRILREALC